MNLIVLAFFGGLLIGELFYRRRKRLEDTVLERLEDTVLEHMARRRRSSPPDRPAPAQESSREAPHPDPGGPDA